MKKIEPKGTINKQISIKLTEAELNRFKAFCKALGMTYSEVFRAMTNQVINKEAKKMGLELKAFEPEITFGNCPKSESPQLDIFKQFNLLEFSTVSTKIDDNLNNKVASNE